MKELKKQEPGERRFTCGMLERAGKCPSIVDFKGRWRKTNNSRKRKGVGKQKEERELEIERKIERGNGRTSRDDDPPLCLLLDRE